MTSPMGIEVTDEARAVLLRSLDLARVAGSPAGIRLRAAPALGGGVEVQVELADEAGEGERVVDLGDLRLFVDRSIETAYPDAVVALEPQHERIVVRPAE